MSFRVAVIEYAHESNTFTIKRTGLHEFIASRYLVGDDVITRMRGTGSEIGGCISVAESESWDLVPIVAAHAEPGGILTEDIRSTITKDVIMRLEAEDPFDGIFIALHGAMVTETSQDGESQFLNEIRNLVGDTIPIAVTLDLHANVFEQMTALINIAVSFRTYPHVDMRERGIEACQLLQSAMMGAINPRVVVTRLPMLVGCDDGRTTNDGPMCRILEYAAEEMVAPGILNIAVNAGFTEGDVYAAGPSVLVTYDQKAVAGIVATSVGDRLCDTIWKYRNNYAFPTDIETCMSRLKSLPTGDRPIIVADYSDNPGSGAYGDCTTILAAFLEAGMTNVALGALYDPEAVQELIEAGIGSTRTLLVGGKTDALVGGGPLKITGTVVTVSDGEFIYEGPMQTGLSGTLGPCVCFRVDGIDILIVSENCQMKDKNLFRTVGIEPTEKSIVVVKSMQHFRCAFEPISAEVLIVDAGGLSTPDTKNRTYKNIRRPVFPLDNEDQCRSHLQ
jgi:microcystin degradation protein MlrC